MITWRFDHKAIRLVKAKGPLGALFGFIAFR